MASSPNPSPSTLNNTEDGEENSGDEDETDEMLDPRVKVELERLNSATTNINELEQELEEMHTIFRQTLSESAFVLKTQANMLGKCVRQSRPYYEELEIAKQIQVETQKAALKYERACSQHQAAKHMVGRAEQKLASTSTEHKSLDPAWQDMLNKAIKKVMDSELKKQKSEQEHLEVAHKLTLANKTVSNLKTKLKSAINKSKIYFDLRDKYMEVLEEHKQHIISLKNQLRDSKQSYSSSLRKLEGISDEIHEMRRSQSQLEMCLSPRQDGVGAEDPPSSTSDSAFEDCSDINEMKRKLEAIDGSIDETLEEEKVETTPSE
ncbi:SH3 domain-binding protein 5-like [Actinia tenebrosa]|uniref:SH3 domain-binding protein 5-like n=1 Tax=Actinia tenebrosa TaxID=6105 RepID=A0A6P8I0L7_ACTTE|nr:SH3 domain-binding protein 5-like [Actinia tenebrosa]